MRRSSAILSQKAHPKTKLLTICEETFSFKIQVNKTCAPVFFNQNTVSERIFTANKEDSLDEPTEIVKDRLNQITNSLKHKAIKNFSKKTSSKKSVTYTTTLAKTNEEEISKM